ncbi:MULTISPECIES: ADP-ribosylglycohydrolase family protein [Streptomyces]|uniref:ADP-ribosylglycohydrolase family protein n=1 Tax=Streptomyces mirabilis TaxID=68239 RepID=A0ABU3UWI9_9ACTN|nr:MULTISPECIES: ADP-ribosylglycohydrolase family protein [Streptomyces]MCX4608059.1 ADP-ribosylglycohydrolase family protein [Streptomyces mirabilis]MCX5348524.1 ADP-ribosylglycohydrolase family protein [Streptomyces mirabilis]MDU8998075.1 ADP-ribosylglycohydrolase family protein [Streptomyces mirabilis]QDN87109.1 ADP-ribosylglycohydrolase family protein [Streptomyces sp. RLB3-6]QDO07922.1 ADP-ribosylglycohydrolase family protein [Streptomyces sp. S1D4-23]
MTLRLTWVQPEDLLGHELAQAYQDGRAPEAIAARWHAAGGPEAPPRAGTSPTPASRYLRALAGDLLDELAELPSGLADAEPTDLGQIRAHCPDWPARPGPAPAPAPTQAHLEAAWLGRAVGCLLGKPVEKLPLEGIRDLARAGGNWPLRTWFTARGVPDDLLRTHPWNRRSAPTSLAENIDGMPEDDDLNYPLLNLLLLQRHGRDFTTADVARLWLDELPAGRTFTAERVAYRNLLTGIEPPHTAHHRNPFREWIGALIRADVHGWTNPGDPAAAAAAAHRDATLTHTANGVYAAMFTAATIAEAATGHGDIHACLRTGLTVVPPASRLAEAIRHAVHLARTTEDFDTVVDALHTTHRAYHWVHALPNTALIAAALTHANGDFSGSICRAVSGGWDTDSNGATAGSVAGLLTGAPTALPDRWTTPLKNRLATSVADFDGIGFDTLAQLTHRLAHQLTHRETRHP